MNSDHFRVGMEVRVGPAPSTGTGPYEGHGVDYVNPACANQVGKIIDVQFAFWATVEFAHLPNATGDGPLRQGIHAAHLEPVVPVPSVNFDDVIGGAELDDLRSLGDQLDTTPTVDTDTDNGEEDDDHTHGAGSSEGLVHLPFPTGSLTVTDTPVPGEFSVYTPQAGDHSAYLDMDDDQLDLFFREQNCQEHGHEAAFTISINGEAVLMTPSVALQVAKFIADRVQRISDRGENVE